MAKNDEQQKWEPSDNYRAGLENELTGLRARFDALGEHGDPAKRDYLAGRIDQVLAALGVRPSASKEKRPDDTGEKRPG